MHLGFVMTPDGGCYVENVSLNCVINGKTVITQDNGNCCLFSVLAS